MKRKLWRKQRKPRPKKYKEEKPQKPRQHKPKEELFNTKQYYLDNKEKFIEKQKQYYQLNKKRILEYKKEKVTCECSAIHTRGNIAQHIKSQKHQKYLDANKILSIE
jgi:hypothetical protein